MNSLLNRIVDLITEKKNYFLIGLIVLTIGLMAFLPKLKIDNALEVWFLKDDPTLINYNEFKKVYGNDEIIAVWVKPDTDIYSKEFVQKIYTISKNLKQSPLIKRVISITSAPYMDSVNNELKVEDLVNTSPDDTFKPEVLKERLLFTPLWKKLMINKDGSAIVVLVEPIVSEDMDAKRPEILDFVKKTFAGTNYKLAGMGVVYDELNKLSMRDSSLFTSLSFLLLLISIFILFRNRHVLFASVITMIICTLLFVGIFCMFGQKFNMVSAVLPSLIVILCLEDVIYIFATYFDTKPGPNRLKESLKHILVPCFFTSLTTALGFLSFVASPMAILKSFGIFASIGVMLEYFVAVIVSAFILVIIDKKTGGQASMPAGLETKNEGLVYTLVRWISGFTQKNYKIVVAASMVILAIAIFFTSKLKVDTYTIEFLLDSNQVKKDSLFIEKDYGFYLPIEVRLKPRGANGVKDPVFLNKLADLQVQIEKHPNMSNATSLVDIVKQLNRILTDRNESSYKNPDSKDKIAQELLLYEMDENNDLANFVTSDYSELRLTIRAPMVSSQNIKKMMGTIDTAIKNVYKDEVEVIFGGYIPLYVKLIDYIAESQISSFAIAFFLIFVSTGLLFRSFYYFMITVIPNIVPIMMTLGIMGAAGIYLDIATVTIAALTIGLSVDNTIQFLYTYKKKIAEGIPMNDAITDTLITTGKPMFISNAILVIGFCVMIFASVKSVIFFGLLIGLTMLFAIGCDLFLLPSLLLLFKREK